MMFLLTNHRNNEAESPHTHRCSLHKHSWCLMEMHGLSGWEAVSGQLPAALSRDHTAEPLRGALEEKEGRKEAEGGWGLAHTPALRL